jgi:hypothetical protein
VQLVGFWDSASVWVSGTGQGKAAARSCERGFCLDARERLIQLDRRSEEARPGLF